MTAIFGYDSGIREMEDKLDPLGGAIAKPVKDWVWKEKPKDPVYDKPAADPVKVTYTNNNSDSIAKAASTNQGSTGGGTGLQIY